MSPLGRIQLDSKESKNISNEGTRIVSIYPFNNGEYDKDSAEATAYKLELLANISKLLKVSRAHRRDYTNVNVINPQELAELADIGAILSSGTANELQQVLENPNVIERAKLSLSILQKEFEILKMKHDNHVSQLQNLVRGAQGGNIKIGGPMPTDKSNKTIEKKWEDRMKINKPPEFVSQVIEEELEKFRNLQPSSMDYNLIRTYVDWLTQLPWGNYTKDTFDIDAATEILDRQHYGLKNVKKRIIEFIAVGSIKQNIEAATPGKILCLIGSPGVGKTSIGKSIAEALGRNFHRISVGGMRDVSEIKGHRRTYVGALPGKIIQAIKHAKSFNPVIMIDEIEKLSSTRDSDPSAALLEVLDPEQNKEFMDHYLDIAVDLSKVLFICTGNSKHSIPEPLKDRMEVIDVPGYSTYDKEQIAEKYLIPKISKETSVDKDSVKFEDNSLTALINFYAREPGVRTLQQKLESLYRKVAVNIVRQKDKTLSITKDNLQKYLGGPDFHIRPLLKDAPPGVVVGLSYNSYGGSVLILESVPSPTESGTCNLSITGSIGSVLKESAYISLALATKILKEIDPHNTFFEKVSK